MMNSSDLLEMLIKTTTESIVPQLSEAQVKSAANNRFVLIRSLSAEALAYYDVIFARELLLKLLVDRNASVRSSAAIGLKNNSGKAVMEALLYAFLNDNDPLTRGYAGSSLIAIAYRQNDRLPVVETSLLKEKNLFVKAIVYGELYSLFGDVNCMYEVVKCYRSKNYRTRCSVCNILLEALKKEHASIVVDIIPKWEKKESVPAVLSSIEKLKRVVEYFLIDV